MNLANEAKFLLTHKSFNNFYASGNKWLKTWTEDGLFDGPYKMWDDDGKLIIDSYCKKGVLLDVRI